MDHSFFFSSSQKNNHFHTVQLVPSFIRPAEKSIIVRFFFLSSTGGKNTVVRFSVQVSTKVKKYSFSGVFCYWIAEEGGCIALDGRLIDWDHTEEASPDIALQWCPPGLLSMPPLWAFMGGTRNHGSRAGSEVSIFFTHSRWVLLLQCHSCSVIVSYNRMVYCIYSDSTWTTPWDSHKVWVKPTEQIVLPTTYGKGHRGESNLLSFQNTAIVRFAYTCHHGAAAHTREVDTLGMCLNFLLLVFWRSVKSKKKKTPSQFPGFHSPYYMKGCLRSSWRICMCLIEREVQKEKCHFVLPEYTEKYSWLS